MLLDPAVPGDLARAKARLLAYFNDLHSWMLTNMLQLNGNKTDFLCVLSPYRLTKYDREASTFGDIVVAPNGTIKSLGTTFDVHLSVSKQVIRIISTCSYRLCQLARIRKNISTHAGHAVVQSLIISRLDYCNVLLAGLVVYQVRRLQKVQDRAARLSALTDPSVLTITLMKNLHSLPVSQENPI